MLFQIPTPAPGAIESWLLAAAAIGGIVLMGLQLFRRKPPIEAEFSTKEELKSELQQHVQSCQPRIAKLEQEYVRRQEFLEFKSEIRETILGINRKLDTICTMLAEMRIEFQTAGERRAKALHERINVVEANVARVDERTKGQ